MTAVIQVRTTKVLRLLDFNRLDRALGHVALSYFDPERQDKLERRVFLGEIHRLIAQPVVPGKESQYLITQTMAEYLAHVYHPAFDGIFFASVQYSGGTNVVLFSKPGFLGDPETNFDFEYVENSLQFVTTQSVDYAHNTEPFSLDKRQELVFHRALPIVDYE